MSNTASAPFEIPAPPEPGTAEVIDDLLVGLPAPPRARRRVLSLLLTAVSLCSLALATQFLDDTLYAFSSSTPIALGDGRTASLTQDLSNRYVTLHAVPSLAGAVTYSRWLFPGEHLVFPVAGRDGEPVYIQLSSSQRQALVHGDFHGRLVHFDSAGGRYTNVGRYLHNTLRAPVTPHTWLFIEDTAPQNLLWAPLTACFLIALSLTNLFLLRRLLRPDNL